MSNQYQLVVTNHEKSVSPHTNIMPLNYQSSMFIVVHARFVTTYIYPTPHV